MKDEIKEILLKDFNEILVKEFCTDWKEKRLYIELLVNSTPFSNLLDHITNLQTIEQQYSAILSENAELENKITNLQEEIKSANDSITWWSNRFNAVQEENKKIKNKLEDEKKNYKRITTYLQEENKRLKEQQQELERYKNIVDELEKFLIEWENKSWEDNGAFKDVYDYLQEQKGSDN